jgi:DNA-binding FrmR family transcriptional regulator
MIKPKNPEIQKNLLTRLNRIEGQIRGVQIMVNQDRECKEILQQLAAIRAAVQGASSYYLQEYTMNCILEQDTAKPQERQQLARDLISLLNKAL